MVNAKYETEWEGEEEGEEEEQWLAVKMMKAGGELLSSVHISREQWRMQKMKEKTKGKEKGKRKSSGWR